MFWDTHTHTHFSGDSSADPRKMVDAARNAGLSGLCFTDHMDLGYPQEKGNFLLDATSYWKELTALQEEYKGRFPIRIGLEAGLQPHIAPALSCLLEEWPYDFVIGSSHLVHGLDPYYPDYYQGRPETQAYREYFDSILENIAAFDGFDVYGHLDYVVRYGTNRILEDSYDIYADVIDAILRALIAKGKGLELNTGGFQYGLGHPNPTESILARYKELGGEVITIGSDAHTPEHVGYAFEQVAGLLQKAGFSYYTVFFQRTPQFIRI